LQPPSDIADDVTTGTDTLAETDGVFGEMAELTDQDEFTEKAGEIDDLQAQAQESLGPLGIDCEGSDSSSGAGSDATNYTSGSDSDSSDDSSGSSGSDGSTTDGASGSVPDPDPASSISDYGSDPALDVLADECEGGDFQACDDLYNQSDFGSSYEACGDTCGGRNEAGAFCTSIYG
jgi:hypothetical protein